MNTTLDFSLTDGAKVLIVDDNIDLLRLISLRLKSVSFETKTAESAAHALAIMDAWIPDLVITDLQMPGIDGMQFFTQVHAQYPLLPVIMITAHGTIPDAVAATQDGVASFLKKPFDGDELVDEVFRILREFGFVSKQKAVNAQESSNRSTVSFNNIASKSPKMAALMQELERLAPTEAVILLEGENGCGKDELARTMHNLSERANESLVHISGAALPHDLFALEMFGKIGNGTIDEPEFQGAFRKSFNGTLILSDFNEASKETVVRFLHALVRKKAKPIDSDQEYEINSRMICTTSVIGRYGKFNSRAADFWEKLEITKLTVPALRERREDIHQIATQCLRSIDGAENLSFANKAIHLMLTAEWPGNVRELVSVVRQCARLCRTKVISESLLNSRLSNPMFQITPLSAAHRDFERNYLTQLLKVTNGNVTKASEMAKRNRTEFHRLLNKHKIEAKSFRT